MTQPMDPNDFDAFEGPSEYSWGRGLFPPGIANNEGQTKLQEDFGDALPFNKIGDARDNYARAVADRRTDSTDPDSTRDFSALGNCDRYGASPPLIREEPQPNRPAHPKGHPPAKTPRKW